MTNVGFHARSLDVFPIGIPGEHERRVPPEP